ncbi:4-amino-4-deoxy-L-arabinose transferase or related glycosyltransferase of PMT family [Methylacidimicrobium sp. AP8]|uniref:ArnT family glycosyltransferase n=1 Tax=Methylacidimicrobium sp. AP8 TaxID=2730359 RepID=UPI0018C19D29|nr:glycosyltransferase family 39 protein [Methylacidimicrobium sp. AP8]CAB4242981.1 4-amino-4-deoxy-L-arabinose transferase or related glycosyltransferase of PMT family [Methylacidimicrobium sp. AP8]
MHRFRPFSHGLGLRRAALPGAWTELLGPVVLLALGVLYIVESAGPVIFDDNEGLYAGAAREMRTRRDWIVPTLEGIPRCQKPPLVYWSILLSTGLFGENEFGVRLPQALAVLAWMAATYRLGATLGDRRLGWSAALILGTAFGSFIFGHVIMPEVFLSASVAWSFWFLWKALTEPEKERYRLGLWVSMAFGALAKGLHALFYPLAVAGLLALFSRTIRKRVPALFRWEGIGLFLLLVVPWYLAMEIRLPGFAWEHFGNEQLGHAVNHRIPPDAGTVRLPIFLAEQWIFLLPWSLFGAALLLPARKPALPGPETQPKGLFLGLWILVTFFSVLPSSLQDYYALSCFPAFALLLARPFCEAGEGRPHWTFWVPFAVISGLAVAAAAAGIAFGSSLGATAFPIAAAPVDQRDTFLAAIYGFPFSTWRAFLPLLLPSSASLFLGGAVGLRLAWRGKRLAAGICLALAMFAPLAEAGKGLRLIADYFSSEKIGRYLNGLPAGEGWIVADGEPHFYSSLFFYLRRDRIYWVHSSSTSAFSLRSAPEAKRLFLSEAGFLALWKEKQPVYWIGEESALQHWKPIFDQATPGWRVVLRCGTRVLAVNH